MSGSQSRNLWGGRFEGSADSTFADFNNSLRVDRRLFSADVRGSIGHCEGLRAAGVLSDEEADSIRGGLEKLLTRADEVDALFQGSDAEDVHSFIESNLVAMVGDAGRKLHTGRSRNDQVSTAFRIWLREELVAVDTLVLHLQTALLDIAEKYSGAVVPGYTHLQRAQPVLWAHWCLAYFEMLRRDRARLRDAAKRVNVMPLGSGALAGTGYAVDREAVAKSLGFDSVSLNSLDGVSDRDFAIETVGAASILMMHLSRLAEDLIIYATAEFGFIGLGDAISTGSSLMPQKKNPDALELIRGKSARVFGHHAALLALMKGLPLAYNKDMQEDKEAVFDAFDTASDTLRVAEIVLRNISLDAPKAGAAAVTGYLNATELADYLVRKGVPFRTAHDTVGRIVLFAIAEACELGEIGIDELKGFCSYIGEDVYEALAVDRTLRSKSVTGGTSPERVAEALAAARSSLADLR